MLLNQFHVHFVKCEDSGLKSNADELFPSQYHIQTDEGDQRFFKYQTTSGQFRKEDRLADGSVAGTYGWVDANGILRLYDYVADKSGYRVLSTRMIDMLKQNQVDERTESKKDNTILSNIVEDNVIQISKRPRVEDPLGSVKSTSPRLQRRLRAKNGNTFTVNVQPLFHLDQDDEQLSSDQASDEFNEEDPFSPGAILKEVQSSVPRLVSETRAGDGRRVVDGNRNRSPFGRPTVDYQNQKSFHYEEEGPDGSRVGQYGYIDPIGVRRVVNYSNGPNGELIKTKENDYVGTNTYFHAN